MIGTLLRVGVRLGLFGWVVKKVLGSRLLSRAGGPDRPPGLR